MKASTARYTLPTDLKVLEPLRDVLGDLPAVFPAEDDRRIRPLAIGIDKLLVAMAVARGANADYAATVVRQVLRRYCRSGAYYPEPTICRRLACPTPGAHPLEPFVMSVTIKAIKVTVVLDPRVLRPAPAGADIVLEVATEGGIAAWVQRNPTSYRKALDDIREQGPDHVTVILQGRMVTPGQIVDAGISAMPKQPKT